MGLNQKSVIVPSQDPRSAAFTCLPAFLAAAALFAGAGVSQAALVTQNVNVTLDASNFDDYNLDVNQDGTPDFTLQTAYSPDPVLTVGFDQFTFPFGGTNAVVIDQFTGDGFPTASLLTPGSVVSASSLFSGTNDQGDLYYYDSIDPTTGNFDGHTGYVGLRFTAAGGTYYGFAQITVDDLNSATPFDLTIGSVTYNNVAGASATVPEPVATASLLGMGLFTLSARRRR
jgi:hypothetical protein